MSPGPRAAVLACGACGQAFDRVEAVEAHFLQAHPELVPRGV